MKRREGNCKRGEQHPRSKCTDAEVAIAIELVEVYGLSAKEVGRKFEVSGRAVRYWVAAQRRTKPA